MLDLEAIKEKWLKLCGACDVGVGECNHPGEDYRPVMLALVRELESQRPMIDALRSLTEQALTWSGLGWRIEIPEGWANKTS